MVLSIPYTGSLPSGSDPVNHVRPKTPCFIIPLLSPQNIMLDFLLVEFIDDDHHTVRDNESNGKESS